MVPRREKMFAAAYGGQGWSPRTTTLREELGQRWRACGLEVEWTPLRAVLLHAPDATWEAVGDVNAVQWLALPNVARAQGEHATLAAQYRRLGIEVHFVEPEAAIAPNLVFVADLFAMTPEGAIVGRPASTVRAGEERWVARRLAELGVPILRTVRGRGTFEGADLLWLDGETALLGRGLRTNAEGAAQVVATLRELGVHVTTVDLPVGSMHLMGLLRLVDRDLALAWPYRLPHAAAEVLRARGYHLYFIPDEVEAAHHMALNIVTVAPRQVLMPAGCPTTQGSTRGWAYAVTPFRSASWRRPLEGSPV